MGISRDPGLSGVERRQLNIVVAIDCSGSMAGAKMASLNFAMRAAVPAMREAARDNPETDVRVRVLQFADQAIWRIREPLEMSRFEWGDLTAGGETSMGMALKAIAQILTPEVLSGRQLPPVIILVSDGQPSDDFNDGLRALFASPYGSKSVRVAIAIGSNADREVLQSFINDVRFQPLVANNAQDLVQRIAWATTAPIKAVSMPSISADSVAELGARAQREATGSEPMSEIMW